MKMSARRFIVHGRVQGVGFRWATKDAARGFEITGTVRNLPDGSVEILVAGEEEEIAAFIEEIRNESSVAHHITDIEASDLAASHPVHDATGFMIERGTSDES